MHIGAPQILGTDYFADGRLDKRRPRQEDSSLVFDNDALIGHGRHVGASGSAGTQYYGNLWYAPAGQGSLVVENPAEMIPVGKDILLPGKIDPTGLHQIDAGQIDSPWLFPGHGGAS